MTFDQFWTSVSSALGWPEVLVTLVAGFLFGVFILGLTRDSFLSTGYTTLVAILIGVVFFVSRGVALYLTPSTLWPRNLGFAAIWVVYSLAMGLGLYVRRRQGPL